MVECKYGRDTISRLPSVNRKARTMTHENSEMRAALRIFFHHHSFVWKIVLACCHIAAWDYALKKASHMKLKEFVPSERVCSIAVVFLFAVMWSKYLVMKFPLLPPSWQTLCSLAGTFKNEKDHDRCNVIRQVIFRHVDDQNLCAARVVFRKAEKVAPAVLSVPNPGSVPNLNRRAIQKQISSQI